MALLSRLLRLRNRRPVFVAVALCVLAYFLAYPFVDAYLRAIGVAGDFAFFDFGAYAGAVDRWHAGEAIYQQGDQGGYHGTYLYPPLTLLVFEPFLALFEYPTNRAVWAAVTTGLLIVGVQLVAGELATLRWYERGVLAWATLGFQPVLLNAKMGQTAGLMGALLCFSYVFLSRQEEDGSLTDGRVAGYLSGLCMGVVGFFKFAYAPTGAHLLADRRRFVGALVTGVALVVTSVAVFGVEAHLTYLDVLAWGIASPSNARSPAFWLPPYYKPLYWVPGSIFLRIAASAGIATLAVRSTGSDRTVFALGVAAFPVLTPLAYAYYLVALLPAGLVLLAGELRRDGWPVVPVVGLWLANVHSFGLKFLVDVVPSVIPTWSALRPAYPLFQPGLWAVLLLAGLAAYRAAQGLSVPGTVSESVPL